MPLVRRAVVVSAAAAVVVAVTGCTGSSSPTPTGTSTWPGGPTTTTSTPSSTTSSPTTTATSDLATRFPNTKAGAEGFAKEYVKVLNEAYAAGSIGNLAEYATAECSRCDGWLKYFGEMQTKHQHGVGTFIVMRDIVTVMSGTRGAAAVAQITVPETKVVDNLGRTVHVRKSEGNVTATFFLKFGTQWRVVGSRVE